MSRKLPLPVHYLARASAYKGGSTAHCGVKYTTGARFTVDPTRVTCKGKCSRAAAAAIESMAAQEVIDHVKEKSVTPAHLRDIVNKGLLERTFHDALYPSIGLPPVQRKQK